jgi:hypothetical protein
MITDHLPARAPRAALKSRAVRDAGGVSSSRVNCFISHAGSDRAWAEWVAWQLTDAGYSVELDVWDWAAGQNFITKISDALDRADRVVALWSAEYFSRPRYTMHEWSAALTDVPGEREGRLVPVRIEDVPTGQVPGILRPIVYRDLFGVAEDEARRVLLEAVRGTGLPGEQPAFPGPTRARPGAAGQMGSLAGSGPRLPGTLPQVWNGPARNLGFTGRDMPLVKLRERLLGGDRAVVQALHGMGGVGKTQLAAEYAHRFASGYDIVWWIISEQAGRIAGQIAALAARLRCAEPDTPVVSAAEAAIAELRARGRWLLVFDNAGTPADLAPWLPGGSTGHVLITTRTGGWSEVAAAPVEIDVFARAESVAVLRERVPGMQEADADRLAQELGDLPLAVAQAASYLADSGMPAAEYQELVQTRAVEILSQGLVMSYPGSLVGATQLTIERLARDHAGAAALAEIGAFLAPEPVPLSLFTTSVDQLPGPLAAAADVLAWRKLVATLSRSSLVRVGQDAMQMHRLTQAILRDRLTRGQGAAVRELVGKVLAASNPGYTDDPVSWPSWARLLPHILAIGPEESSNPDVRSLACRAAWYLLMRGDTRGGHDLAERLHQHWKQQLGSDDADTLWAANCLGASLRQLGRLAEARRLDEDTLARCRRTLGQDHPSTLNTASNLAADFSELGNHQGARELNEDILNRRRRVLGEDHPGTLNSASNLARDLSGLGDHQAAGELETDLLARRRRVLGEDHPSTLNSASNLARHLSRLGDHQTARKLDQDVLTRRRRVLGEDHPSTLSAAVNLATDLTALGEHQAARELNEDTDARDRRLHAGDADE